MTSSPPPAAETPTPGVPRTEVDGVRVLGSISPSRAGDFLTCPLLYRLRTIDRLPEVPSAQAARGTVVHKVLEDLFDLPAPERTPERAGALVDPSWEAVLAAEPRLAQLFDTGTGTGAGAGTGADTGASEVSAWLESCRAVLATYFSLEDPRRLEPAERELYVETLLESGLLLRGYVDRVDIAPDGAIRIVDYKTGRSPSPDFETQSLFQLKFYALVLWRMRGVLPTMLQLVYLGNAEVLRYRPDEQELLATERKVEAVWRAIEEVRAEGEWRPRRSRLCGWCSYQALCPEFGGTPPPLPAYPDAATTPDPGSVESTSSSLAPIVPAAISSAQ